MTWNAHMRGKCTQESHGSHAPSQSRNLDEIKGRRCIWIWLALFGIEIQFHTPVFVPEQHKISNSNSISMKNHFGWYFQMQVGSRTGPKCYRSSSCVRRVKAWLAMKSTCLGETADKIAAMRGSIRLFPGRRVELRPTSQTRVAPFARPRPICLASNPLHDRPLSPNSPVSPCHRAPIITTEDSRIAQTSLASATNTRHLENPSFPCPS